MTIWEAVMSSGATAGVRTYKNYVNGEWVASASGETFPVYDPSTEEVIAQVAAAGAADVDRAVKAARAAFDSGPWPTTTAQDRGRILFKLAEQTPLTALEFASWSTEVGLPPGVVNIINGLGETAGAALVAHPGVDKIAFTGSATVGKIIVKSAADTLKRVTLELGGKSPNIFFTDADWEASIDGALFGVFINQGEVCSAGSRILVEKRIYSKFVEAMTEKAKRIKLGAPLERETKMGPLVSKEQYDRVSSYLELGKKEAKVAIGGGRPKQFGKGYYLEPTIFYDVDNTARIAREEIFGPVASVIPFDGEADAIRIANDTPYGLAAAVWTRDIYKAFRVVKSLRAGIVWVNHMQPTYVEAPWGGYKQSGFGRELGPWGLEEYLETKQVFVNLDETPIGWY